jgi:hypothetical protein
MKSLAGVPLYYVVRDDLPATHDFQGDDEEERLRQIRHTGHERMGEPFSKQWFSIIKVTTRPQPFPKHTRRSKT